MYALRGTFRLLRLTFRLDRVKLVIWLVAIVGLIAITLPELEKAYGTLEKGMAYAASVAPSMVSRLFGGALTGPSLGEITMVETFSLAAVLVALMNIFALTRHTRNEEEAGRSELISSMIVGRQAGLTAALLQACIVNSVIGLLLYGVFLQNDYHTAGALAYSLGIASIGMVFAAVGAITSQLFESTRTANSFAGLLFGVSFMVWGVGNALGTVNPDGMSVTANWLAWLSPLGWATNMLPFHDEQWWVLGLFGVFIIGLVTGAYILLARRDVGAGIFAAKPGRADAPPKLLKPFGLLWRLNRSAFIGWLAGCVILGGTLGAVANEFTDLIAGNEEMQQMLAAYGQADNPADLMFSATFTITGVLLTAYGLQLLLRMRAEETGGRLEAVLATPTSRPRWMLRSVTFTSMTALLILLATGLSAGFVYGLIDGEVVDKTLRMGGSIMVHAPALLVILGCSLLAFAVLPRLAAIISWAVLGGCLLIIQLGAILGLPQWTVNLSPFSHTPAAPAAEVTLQPLYILVLVAFVLMLASLKLFSSRDLTTE